MDKEPKIKGKIGRIDLRKTRRYSVAVFDTKAEALRHLASFGFKDGDQINLLRKGKRWLVWLSD